jgi:hypothetical protein
VIEKKGLKRWWGSFQKDLLPENLLGAICDALGKIGTKESIPVLSKLEKSLKDPLVQKVREALKRIEERTGKSGK